MVRNKYSIIFTLLVTFIACSLFFFIKNYKQETLKLGGALVSSIQMRLKVQNTMIAASSSAADTAHTSLTINSKMSTTVMHFKVESLASHDRSGVLVQKWEGDNFSISIVADKPCGISTWEPSFLIENENLHVIVNGTGYPMNCPSTQVLLTFMFSNLPKKEYHIIPNITFSYLQ